MELIKDIISEGNLVVLLAPTDSYVPALEELGAKFIDVQIHAHGTNPLNDLLLIWKYIQIIKKEKPNIILTYTVKPNIYASFAAQYLEIPVVNNISGLGAAFIRGGWMFKVLKILYRLALAKSKMVFFQNPDDLNLFTKLNLVKKINTNLLPGSGINLQKFKKIPLPVSNNRSKTENNTKTKFVFLLVARMLKEKGIEEYVKAASSLKIRYPNCIFALLGPCEIKSPSGFTNAIIQSWVTSNNVTYWGESKDVSIEITAADCVVLPSYREGTPRSLLEAAAMGRPLIATDVPGCREVVKDGVNGLLCKPREYEDLAFKMETILNMSIKKLEIFGEKSRLLVEEKYEEKKVIEKYREIINKNVK
jgi:glycosyltransferase involved in cell wall biosynthesis